MSKTRKLVLLQRGCISFISWAHHLGLFERRVRPPYMPYVRPRYLVISDVGRCTLLLRKHANSNYGFQKRKLVVSYKFLHSKSGENNTRKDYSSINITWLKSYSHTGPGTRLSFRSFGISLYVLFHKQYNYQKIEKL